MRDRHNLLEKTRRDVDRLNRKDSQSASWIGMLFYGGTLDLLFVTPIVLGAYLGRWLDTLAAGYSVRWTVSLIVLGIVTGGYNVFRFIQRH
ncbi:AtpZ/AtpI family protein [Methylomonas methanica]|uniref:F0F1-ATPase subunit n=1 Tax=Methylomonas methanica (strain DSM 25384 / MC09) TaxID=857087 RepID=G0A6H6_METMM|nr:AtpZ/AtpI family protein [Methylomonas methanica]AEF99277.1 F0F1-ATPase subunit [Methylomonas methanica MC09]